VFWSHFIPCADCGEAIERSAAGSHDCDPQRRVEFTLAAMHHRIGTFDSDLEEFLVSNEGRFESWLAAREVRRSRRSA
jgi:hypothetical protein